MFLSDTPIKSLSDDLLGRERFANALANNLHACDQEESIVIGLFGPWGSGKTSLINMTLDHLQSLETSDSNYIIVKFNPWNFSNTDDLLIAFFTQVFAIVGSKSERFKDFVSKRLKNYGDALKQMGSIPMVGTFMGSFGSFLDFAIQEKGLSGYRERLDEAFKGLDGKVIIVVDDLDRLRQTEIRQMLQVVKLNANFPNTIYLLAASREVLEKSLETEQGISGKDYLEKIVQVGFDIPPIDHTRVTEILLQGINETLSEFVAEVDQNRWAEIYQGGFRSFFTNLRDIKRFLNGLSFNFSLVSSEVNVEDFIALETIRIFAHEVYAKMAENKHLFVSDSASSPDVKDRVDEIFSVSKKHKDVCKALAIKLFPKIQTLYYYGNTNYFPSDLESLRKSKRICVSKNFDSYFLLGVPVGEVSHAELERIKAISQNKQELSSFINEIFEGNRFRQLIERLPEILNELQHDNAVKNLEEVLFSFGDQIPIEPSYGFSLETNHLVASITYQLLQKLDNSERCSWLKDQLIENKSLYNPIRQVAISDSYLQKGKEGSLFDSQCIQELKSTAVSRIEKEAENRMLIGVNYASFILSKWRDWADADAKKKYHEFITDMIATPEKAAQFLTAFLGASTFNYEVVWGVDIKELAEFVDPQRVLEQVLRLTPEQLSEASEKTLKAVASLYDIFSKKASEEEE
ncbi:MAG: hypothetical protein H6667_10750 [Ardenticatenaceae bacterium]|nr:hypothetical protein [Ardenticatenaceae bacterium]MCB9444418.1 hypothetical protein [Ardenticatenaceae bacterium]